MILQWFGQTRNAQPAWLKKVIISFFYGSLVALVGRLEACGKTEPAALIYQYQFRYHVVVETVKGNGEGADTSDC